MYFFMESGSGNNEWPNKIYAYILAKRQTRMRSLRNLNYVGREALQVLLIKVCVYE